VPCSLLFHIKEETENGVGATPKKLSLKLPSVFPLFCEQSCVRPSVRRCKFAGEICLTGLRVSAGLELLDGDGIHDLVVVRLCPGLGSARLMVAQSEGVQVATHPKRRRRRFLSTLGYEAARVQFIYRHVGSCLVDLDFLPL
jgi:hypothetical protein